MNPYWYTRFLPFGLELGNLLNFYLFVSNKVILLQNGSKESTPDVCPEFRQNLSNSQSTDENSETVHVSNKTETDNDSNGVDEIVTNGTSRLERKTNQIESSTDTLVPDLDNQVMEFKV